MIALEGNAADKHPALGGGDMPVQRKKQGVDKVAATLLTNTF